MEGVFLFFLEKSGLQLLIGLKPPYPTQNFRPSYGSATGPTTNLSGGEEEKKRRIKASRPFLKSKGKYCLAKNHYTEDQNVLDLC